MKTNLIKSTFFFCISFGIFSVNSQTQRQRNQITKNYNSTNLNTLEQSNNDEFNSNYSKALRLAKLYKWPLTIFKENYEFSQLKGVTEDGIPLYYKTNNMGSARTSRANQLQPQGSLGLNLTGREMFVGVWDGNLPRINHLDFDTRVSVYDNSTQPDLLHATHVTGTLISSGSQNTTGRGIAYEAFAFVSDWLNDITEMTALSQIGMLISNHSYGLDSRDGNFPISYFGAYINSSQQIDNLMFSAPYYQPIVAAGNDRNPSNQSVNPEKSGHDLLTAFTTSKNAIVVAAVNEVNDFTNSNNIVMSNFSSWGPTDDNRIKPDIATKGVNVLSTTNATNSSYGFLSGTSMATPGIAATLLLLQQHFGNLNNGEYMRSASLRGLMCHTADEAGNFDGPDSRFGWGLINAEKAAQTISDTKNQKSLISELNLIQGETYSKTVIASGDAPLIATLSWTDRPGNINSTQIDLATPVLVNDLDIRITKDSEIFFPWRLNDIVDQPSVKEDNKVDNIEKVEIKNPTGVYQITVTNKGTLVGGNQDYSLIVNGINLNLSTTEKDFKVLNIWPNPAKDQINISFESDESEEAYMSLYNAQGKILISKTLEFFNRNTNSTIDINSLSPGIYLIKINQGAKQSIRKFIKM